MCKISKQDMSSDVAEQKERDKGKDKRKGGVRVINLFIEEPAGPRGEKPLIRIRQDEPVDWDAPWRFKLPPLTTADDAADIDMDWDDLLARACLDDMLRGLGVMYVKQLTREPLQYIHGRPIHMFQVCYTFDVKDPALRQPDVVVCRPMFKFRLACFGVRETLKNNHMGYTTVREDLGPGHFETDPCLLAVTVDETCKYLSMFQSPQAVRSIMNHHGVRYDALYRMLPTPP